MFKLSEEDIEKWKTWNTEHKKVCKSLYAGAIGGRLTYCFTPTGLGTIIEVKCLCGETLDLTDVDAW